MAVHACNYSPRGAEAGGLGAQEWPRLQETRWQTKTTFESFKKNSLGLFLRPQMYKGKGS